MKFLKQATSVGHDLFEKDIFDRIFQHLMENNLLNLNQSRFMPRNSYINLFQLPVKPVKYGSLFASNPSLEVRGVF